MSIEARQALVNNPHLSFQRDSQKADLLDPNRTQTQLIAALQHLLLQGWYVCVTAVVSDHHDDTEDCKTGPPYCGTHAHGWSVDLWPMNPENPKQFMVASDPHMQKFLTQCSNLLFLHQVGLGGSSDTPIDEVAAGPTEFPDSTADHVHIGTQLS